jgi:hypothetical protein
MRISVEGTTYDFDENSADNVELMAIERVTGMTTSEWAEAVGRGSMLGITALVWIMRRREESGLEFGDVHFHPASLKIENDEPGKDVATSPTT